MKQNGYIDSQDTQIVKAPLTRRGFVGFMGRAVVATAVGGGLILELSGCALSPTEVSGKHEVTDNAGRKVVIPTPSRLKRIYFTSALAQVFCYTLAPELAAGTAIQFSPEELEYLPEGTKKLPFLGSLSGNGTIDREALVVEDVQVVFSISGVDLTEANVSEAVDLQDQTSIPVVLIDGSFERIADAYRLLGECLGQVDRAEKLAKYCEEKYAAVTKAVETIPESERVGLYYAEGPEGLQTEPSTSQHALTFKLAGARNVAQVDLTVGMGMTNVSLESVLSWDPEVIVAWSEEIRGGADQDIRTNKDWAPIKAVRDGRVYTMPNAPFAWCDRPPGVNRLIGIQWVANMLYPSVYQVDMIEEIQNFYEMFYWTKPTREQCLELLGNSYPPVERVK